MARLLNTKIGWDLQVASQPINVTSDRDALDPKWKAMCECGTEVSTRTMTRVVDKSHWCDGFEGLFNHDPHEAIDEMHYECANCTRHVFPSIIRAGTPQYIPGMIEANLTAYRSDGVRFTCWLNEQQTQEALDVSQTNDEEQMQAFADNIPLDQYMSWQFVV